MMGKKESQRFAGVIGPGALAIYVEKPEVDLGYLPWATGFMGLLWEGANFQHSPEGTPNAVSGQSNHNKSIRNYAVTVKLDYTPGPRITGRRDSTLAPVRFYRVGDNRLNFGVIARCLLLDRREMFPAVF